MVGTSLSPVKTKRMDEKQTLQSLNNRLELYVLRVKEMEDAKNIAEKKLENIRDRMEQEHEATKLRLTKEVETLRNQLDFELEQKMRLQMLEQEQMRELVLLREQVAKLTASQLEADKIQVELTKERVSLKSAKEGLAKQASELSSLRRQIKELQKENRQLNASLGAVENELVQLKGRKNDDYSNRDDLFTQIRQEFNQKQQDALAQWKKETEERLKRTETELRTYYDGMIEGYKVQLKDVTSELETLKQELERTATEYDESLKVRQSLAEKVSQLDRDYRSERKKFQDDRRNYELQLEQVRQARLLKEQEFNDLMDVKIALDSEISAYRSILDREETRVGIPTPPNKPNTPSTKKRKGDDRAGGAKRSKKRATQSPIKIAELNLQEERIVLENTSKETISLKGWHVGSKRNQKEFSFPASFVLNAHCKVSVLCGPNQKPVDPETEQDESIQYFVAKGFDWNKEGDIAFVKNDQGQVVDTLRKGTLPPELMEEDDDASNGCTIM